ncbi:MAG: hypothetical protein KTR32_39880 [Granulosicoccus sp.]|nr:hypothetical protein [Granulosicoccus sp.]
MNRSLRSLRQTLLLCALITLTACSSDNDDTTTTVSDTWAFVAARASDFSSGQTERLAVGSTIAAAGALDATGSDIRVTSDGESVYQLGRFSLDNVTKYNPDDVSAPIYQYSVIDSDAAEGEGANPYQVVFANDSKAYVIRYGSPRVWIINPSADNEAAFKIGELDLSAYDALDITPEANGAVIVNEKLYILMERLERPAFSVGRPGYVAVFNTVDDTEIDTMMGIEDGLPGIPLNIQNPDALQYSAADGLLYLIGRGNSFAAQTPGLNRLTGGIESIDPDTYERLTVLDDGTETGEETDTTVEFMNGLLVVSATRAYVITTESFGNNSLRSLNLLTNTFDEGAVADLANKDLTTMAVGPQNRLWVGQGGDEPGFVLLDPATGEDLGITVNTNQVPVNVVFLPRDNAPSETGN